MKDRALAALPFVPLPLATAVVVGVVAGLVVAESPDNPMALGWLFLLASVGSGLLFACLVGAVRLLRHQPVAGSRLLTLALPITLYVLTIVSLQGARLLGPLTLAVGLLMVILAEYILWPKSTA